MTARLHLGLETATDRLSIAVRMPDGEVVEEVLEGARRHASALVPLVDRLVRQAGGGPDAIGLVAVAEGPGSFTGLRVGAAVAKAIAIAGGIPMWSAPSLLVRAAGIAHPGETVVAVTSALRGELFTGAWEFHPDGSISERLSPRALPATGLASLPLADRACGDGPPELIDAVARQVGAPVLGPPTSHPSAAALLRLVGVQGGAVRVDAPSRWEPVYGRPAEAQVQWELRHERPFPDPERHAG
jgi:tRNA threonylcarbamoyladenosine biosynthesis protein TsaB